MPLTWQEFYRYYQQFKLEGPGEQETKLDLISKGQNSLQKLGWRAACPARGSLGAEGKKKCVILVSGDKPEAKANWSRHDGSNRK